MRKNYYKLPLFSLLLGMGAWAFSQQAVAQAVIFPQAQQAGQAVFAKSETGYTLSNALLRASFVKQGGTLVFGGCPELNLEAGSELFEIKLGDGSTTVKASQMTLVGEVREVAYAANAQAVKGSKRLAGKAIEADFRQGDLRITWRAVLRDGSHYLRTELSLTADRDVKLFSITPMTYEVNVQQAGSAPRVVGNTRGAVLMSDKLFAGLETPTGINSAGSADQANNFQLNAWTDASFAPATEVPAGITALGYTSAQIVTTQGYASFKQAGEQTVTFQYQSGNHRLNIVGVDVCKLDGTVVSSDYHFGYTGGAKENNVYRISVPEKGVYQVRYWMEVRTESIASSGTITYSGRVSQPVIVYDLAPGSAPKATVQALAERAATTRALSQASFADGDAATDSWTSSTWKQTSQVPSRINELGWYAPNVYHYEQPVSMATKGALTVEFSYRSGNNRLDLCGVDLVDSEGNAVTYDYHNGFTGLAKEKNVFSLNVPFAGSFKLRYFVTNKNEALTSSGNIALKFAVNDTLHLAASATMPIRGLWSRNTTLKAGQTWEVGAVVGLVAPNQPRRSFLAYSERERAVPWRAMPAYVSWYELNIDRNNDRNYTGNMHDYQCDDVVRQWKKNLFDKYGENVNSFVWDDGWDTYGTWSFNQNFPKGFAVSDSLAKTMTSGIGAWLGPVGGYGQSGNYRREYWTAKGGMQLSNPAYYKVFTDAISSLTKSYDFRFFKFDGISAQFSATGPDAGTVGEENAEGIISAERMVRRDIKEDIFFNTSVGTWASPFWFNVTDAIWRQEGDYGEIGNQGSDRERWITYRDRLVYQNFVQNSPICPINTLMTHGFILSRFGQVSKNMDYDGIVREMRCAFACGSGMVELYNDYALMNSIKGGRLWGELAECLRWQKANADVLPDAHWVGGNPWDGAKANVYGWASWNGQKATLALRNPAASPATFKTTLRAALEIPAYVSGSMTFHKAFSTQAVLAGFAEDEAIDIDREITFALPASSVYVFDGRNSDIPAVETTGVSFAEPTAVEVLVGRERALVWNVLPANATNQTVTWQSLTPEVATVANGVVKGLKAGEAQILVRTENGLTQTLTVKIVEAIDEPYATSFDKEQLATRTDRVLNSVSISANGAAEKTLRPKNDHRAYQDLTAEPIEVAPAAELRATMNWTGSWMHSYVYLDADQNERFEVKTPASAELVAFNYYQGQQKGQTGLSAQSNQNPGVANIPTFVAPTKPGNYRLRLKIDWDNINPAGNPGPSNEILSNGGYIVDLLLKVTDPTAITSATATQKAAVSYDLSGRRTNATAAGIYVVNGKKVAK